MIRTISGFVTFHAHHVCHVDTIGADNACDWLQHLIIKKTNLLLLHTRFLLVPLSIGTTPNHMHPTWPNKIAHSVENIQPALTTSQIPVSDLVQRQSVYRTFVQRCIHIAMSFPVGILCRAQELKCTWLTAVYRRFSPLRAEDR